MEKRALLKFSDRYRPLASFSQKLRFLIDIQIAIFDQFHSRLHSSLEAYLSITSSIARAVQGVSKEEVAQLEGIGGLERLCRIYGSAEYLEKKMRDWSDDVFFLELWDELQDRARRHQAGTNLAGPLSVADVAERTSSTVASLDESTPEAGGGGGGALFDETASAYRRLRIRTETIMQEALIHTIRDSLRPYTRINPWSALPPESDPDPVLTSSSPPPSSSPPSNLPIPPPLTLTLTPELDIPIHLISTSLSFLSLALAPAPLRRIARHLSLSIQNLLWDHLLMRYTFSAAGGHQFSTDLGSLCAVIDRAVGPPGLGELSMRKLREGGVLLCLEALSSSSSSSLSSSSQSTSSPLNANPNSNPSPSPDEETLRLDEVEKQIFASNESCRSVLARLGLESLTEGDARALVGRRVEIGG